MNAIGISGEIIIADNGSTDGSQALAKQFGLCVIDVQQKGYGAALLGGFHAAKGKYLVMGDADGSYDFHESIPMIHQLISGADICMGSRFLGTIKPGAMPWKNRYIGNPVLTGILNLFFGSRVSDAHCGLRALTKACFEDLKLSSTGMEFASEMIVKAALLGKNIAEVPITLYPDTRNRPPHLRPWRDGWRHLVFLLMLSPLWLFLVPGLIATALGISILLSATAAALLPGFSFQFFGNTWAILAGGLIVIGHQCWIFSLASYFYGVNLGYRHPLKLSMLNTLKLENLLVSGLILVGIGILILSIIFAYWSSIHFQKIGTVAPQLIGITFMLVGMQNIFGGFLLAIISGNKSHFYEAATGYSSH
jgi:glycosyltransferase involved in cell wall biosynthesis